MKKFCCILCFCFISFFAEGGKKRGVTGGGKKQKVVTTGVVAETSTRKDIYERAEKILYDSSEEGLENLRKILHENDWLAQHRASNQGPTLLHFAVFLIKPEAIKILLRFGADPHAKARGDRIFGHNNLFPYEKTKTKNLEPVPKSKMLTPIAIAKEWKLTEMLPLLSRLR